MSAHPFRLRLAAALPRIPGLDNDEPGTVALRTAIHETVMDLVADVQGEDA